MVVGCRIPGQCTLTPSRPSALSRRHSLHQALSTELRLNPPWVKGGRFSYRSASCVLIFSKVFAMHYRSCYLSVNLNLQGENSQPSTLKNGQPNSPGLLMMGEQRTTLPLPTTPPILNTFQSSGGTYSTPSVPPRSSDGQMAGEIVGGGQQLMHQTHYQAQILRLERELATVRRQASGCTDVSLVDSTSDRNAVLLSL